MGFFDALTGAAQEKDINAGFLDSQRYLDTGRAEATGSIKSGYNAATKNYNNAIKTLGTGRRNALSSLDSGLSSAEGAYQPYMDAGQSANTLYGNALGLNGLDAQKSFGANYAASDPFRDQNAQMATEQLMRSLNARGMSGSGYAAEAVARQNLARGSEDYQNYLTRLAGLQGQGLQTAGNIAQMRYGTGQQRAGVQSDYAANVANVYGNKAGASINRGNALADLSYGYGQQMANMRTGQANALAQNESTGWNNLMGLAGLGVQAYTGGIKPKVA